MEENEVYTEPQEQNGVVSGADDQNQKEGARPDGTVSVKFNKEIMTLTAEEAATLAQKGMKFEMIENDYIRLRDLAAKDNMSVSEYINRLQKRRDEEHRERLLKECGGNSALADRVLELENGKKPDDGLEELREYFPTVRSLSDLPRAVVESARLRGENLLKSYLTYRLMKKRQTAEESRFEQSAGDAGTGSLKGGSGKGEDDFIKALWGRG